MDINKMKEKIKTNSKLRDDILYMIHLYTINILVEFEWLKPLLDVNYGYEDNELIDTGLTRYKSINLIKVPSLNLYFKEFIFTDSIKEYRLLLTINDGVLIDYHLTEIK